jgi:hypothetical protein
MKRILRRLCCAAAALALFFALIPPARADYIHVGDQAFEANGWIIPLPGLEIGRVYENCWAFAQEAYTMIWGQRFSEFIDSEDDMLRGMDEESHELNEQNLRAFVEAAEIGAVMRLCNYDCLYGDDEKGHSQIILQHDEYGLTVYEGDIGWNAIVDIAYYTWDTYLALWSRYDYIKYVKWPGARPFVEEYTASNCPLRADYLGSVSVPAGSVLYTMPWRTEERSFSASRPVETAVSLSVTALVENDLGDRWYAVSSGEETLYAPGDLLPPDGLRGCTARPFRGEGSVCRESALLRSAPESGGTAAVPLEQLGEGAPVTVLGLLEDPDGSWWAEAVAGSAAGYLHASSLRLPYRAVWSVTGYASLRPAPGDPHRLRDLWRGQRVVSAALRFASDGTLWLETTEGSFVLSSELTLLRSADTLAPRPMPDAPAGWYAM